jgi:hypothetical protein
VELPHHLRIEAGIVIEKIGSSMISQISPGAALAIPLGSRASHLEYPETHPCAAPA